MIGHSNMAGQQFQKSDGVTMPRVWNYEWNKSKTWVLAKETPGSRANGLSGHGAGGPSMPFLKGLAAAYPDYYFGVISNASLSATCRGENTGNNTSDLPTLENRYWKGTILYNELLTHAKAIQNEVTFGGIVCMLGSVEATRTPDSVCRAFGADLAQMATDIRTDLGVPDMPFLMGAYEAGATGTFKPTLALPSIIDAQIKLLPTLLSRSAVIDSKGIEMLDDHHYTVVGQGEFAKRGISIIQTNKWLPGMSTSIRIAPRTQSSQSRTVLLETHGNVGRDAKGRALSNPLKSPSPIWILKGF
jgi:Carbohydrate esterase, sialic acid-specific acetylesterase